MVKMKQRSEKTVIQGSKLKDATTLNACKKCQLRLQILEQGRILHLDIQFYYEIRVGSHSLVPIHLTFQKFSVFFVC